MKAQPGQRTSFTPRPAARDAASAMHQTEPSKPAAPGLDVEQMIELQRHLGNQAVLQLMRKGTLPSLKAADVTALVQRTHRGVSHADPSLAVDDAKGVITAVAAGQGQGHTIMYVEKVKEAGGDWILELGGASQEAIKVDQASEYELSKLNQAGTKRSWSVGNSQLDAALATARDIKDNAKNYVYRFIGTGFSLAKKKAINCARFGEEILKAAGVKASSGLIFKTPMELATGKKRFFKPTAPKKAAAPTAAQPQTPAAYDI